MSKWNDTDVPLAYLITFRTYGTWLHGDTRGSTDKKHNRFGTRFAESRIVREQQQMVKLKSEPFVLNAKARAVVEGTIREVCYHRDWILYALNVRSNHAHSVVSGTNGDKILNDFKAYATRRLKEAGLWPHSHSPWSDKGSKRFLWNDDQIAMACGYVLNGQDDELSRFDG